MYAKRHEFQGEIQGRPDFSYLVVGLSAGQSIMVEAGSMATMSPNVVMKTKMKGGVGRILTGESIFVNEFLAEGDQAVMAIAPPLTGDISSVTLEEQVVYLSNGSYLASGKGIKTESKWQGFMKGFFSGTGFFLIRCIGYGDVFFSSYGGMIEQEIDGDYIVDTDHIVAFSDGLEYQVKPFGGYKSFFFSGEGMICHFRGRGKVWLQTRKFSAFERFVYPFRRVQKKSD